MSAWTGHGPLNISFGEIRPRQAEIRDARAKLARAEAATARAADDADAARRETMRVADDADAARLSDLVARAGERDADLEAAAGACAAAACVSDLVSRVEMLSLMKEREASRGGAGDFSAGRATIVLCPRTDPRGQPRRRRERSTEDPAGGVAAARSRRDEVRLGRFLRGASARVEFLRCSARYAGATLVPAL